MESDITFNEEENKIPEGLLRNLKTTLPHGYNSKVIKYKELTSSTHEVVIRLNIRNKEDALKWLHCYEVNSFTIWKVKQTYVEDTKLVVFKKIFRCHHNTRPSTKAVLSARNTNCPAKITITVKQTNIKSSKDVELKERPCQICLALTHNHSLKSAAALKYRKPTELGNITEDSSTVAHEDELGETEDDLLKGFMEIVTVAKQLLNSNPTEATPAIKNMIANFRLCKSETSMISFLHNCGKPSGLPAIKKGKNLQGGKVHLGGRIPPKRPHTSAQISDHDYSLQMGSKKKKRVPHSISDCVEKNASLGQ